MWYLPGRSRRYALAVLAAAVTVPFVVVTSASGRETGIGGVEHFACYTGAFEGFASAEFEFANQFGRGRGALLRPQLLCAPAKKNAELVQNRRSHLMCYTLRLEGEFKNPDVSIKNQFGSDQRFTVLRPVSLCMPAAKSRTQMPPNPARTPSHFTCFGLKPFQSFAQKTITISDQFEKVNGTVHKAATLCAPTLKNDERPLNERVHLLCYLFKSVTKVHPKVFVRDQFEELTGRIRARTQVCVPSTKKVLS